MKLESDTVRMLVGVCTQLELNGVPIESLGVIGLSSFWLEYKRKELESEKTRIARRKESVRNMPTVKVRNTVYIHSTPFVDDLSQK